MDLVDMVDMDLVDMDVVFMEVVCLIQRKLKL